MTLYNDYTTHAHKHTHFSPYTESNIKLSWDFMWFKHCFALLIKDLSCKIRDDIHYFTELPEKNSSPVKQCKYRKFKLADYLQTNSVQKFQSCKTLSDPL